MAPNETPGSRKRGRPRNDESDVDLSDKKPRLTSSTTSKRTTPNSLRSLSSAISGSFGYGERKVSANGAIKKGRQPVDKTWEIPDSDEEREKSRSNKQAHTVSGSSIKRPGGEMDGVYDFQGSDEEPSTPSKRMRGVASAAVRSSTTPKSTTTAARQGGGRTAPQPTSQGLERQSRRSITKTYSQQSRAGNVLDDEDDTADVSDSGNAPTPTAARSTTRKRNMSADVNIDQPKLKGILTPRKRPSERNPKSVAFDEPRAKTDDVYFADLPSKPNKSKASQKARPSPGKENNPAERADGVDEDEEDDEVCAICSKPDSNPPNEILFCDNCNMPVHQKCYGIAKIPKGDWLCRGCSQEPLSGSSVTDKTSVAAEVVPDIANFEQHLRSLQRVLLDRCTGRRRVRLRDQDEAYYKTFQLVEQTVLAGEGNSMLIIGARGCGKTTMVDSVLSDLSLEHKNEFHVVRLNGFIHTDDKVALKDIWRQLGKEMEVEDELIGKTNNYADTLASLLALLSHPSEITEMQEGVTSKSVVFIIDEFDLFATHARQTLLYNLFDIAQARKAPIAVLGLTNRIDVVEGLEKRVKSRFSHRYVYLSLSKTLAAYWDICKHGLLVDDEDAKAEGLDNSLKGFAKFQDYWTKKINALYKDPAFQGHLEYHYYSTKSVPAFLGSCVLPLANLSPTNLSLQFSPAPSAALTIDPPDSKLHLLEALSDMDLSLLISAARLDIVAHTDTVNFAMAYDEYTTLIGRQRVQSATSGMLALGGGVRVWGRGIAEMSWERLVSLGLLLPTGMGGRHGGLEGKMWKVDVTLEEIPVAVKLNAVLARWCKEI